jgi:hypothetical protein
MESEVYSGRGPHVTDKFIYNKKMHAPMTHTCKIAEIKNDISPIYYKKATAHGSL